LAANGGTMSGFCRNGNASRSEGLRDVIRLTFFGSIYVYDRVRNDKYVDTEEGVSRFKQRSFKVQRKTL